MDKDSLQNINPFLEILLKSILKHFLKVPINLNMVSKMERNWEIKKYFIGFEIRLFSETARKVWFIFFLLLFAYTVLHDG